MTDRKYGRRAPKNAPALLFSKFWTGELPEYPALADNLGSTGWEMLGNDRYGDCVAVTWANYRRLMTRRDGNESYPAWAEVEKFYKTQNPNFPTEDNGMDIQTALEDLVKNGGPDGTKSVAFAKLDYTNPAEVKAAIAIFGAIWVGINVQSINQTQFDESLPWDYVKGALNEGGHSIITGGYGTGSGVLGGDERFITWAQETSFTDNFWKHQVEEAWVVVWPENLGTAQFQQGVDLETLAADFQTLTGKTLPVFNPAPTPSPEPTPDVDAALVAAGDAWEKSIFSHFTKAGEFKAAFEAWKQAHNY